MVGSEPRLPAKLSYKQKAPTIMATVFQAPRGTTPAQGDWVSGQERGMTNDLHQMAAQAINAGWLALSIGVISWIIAKEEIFRPIRDPCKKFTEGEYFFLKKIHSPWYYYVPFTPLIIAEAICRKLAYIPTCEFCTSVWVTAFFLWKVTSLRIGEGYYPALLVTEFALVGLANLFMNLYSRIRVEITKDKTITQKINGGNGDGRLAVGEQAAI